MVVRIALIVALGLAAAVGVAQAQQEAPAVATPQGNASRGAIVYRSSCGLCHRDARIFTKRFRGTDPAVRGKPLEDYINGHHAPQGGPKRDLIAYLKTL